MKEMNLWRNLTTQKGPQAVTRRSALTHCAPPCLSFSFHTLHVRARARTQASRAHVFVENKKLGRGAVAERLSCNGGWTGNAAQRRAPDNPTRRNLIPRVRGHR